MHEAYEVIPIVQKLPPGLQIETISAYGKNLFIIVYFLLSNIGILYLILLITKNVY